MGVLVGRKQELRQVSASLAARGSTVLVGEAGVGKTSLARAAAADSGLEFVEAGSFATLSWLAYLPFRRALGRDPVGGDPAYVAREVEDAVGSRALLVDDLHWADEQSREVVGFLVGRVPLVVTLRLGAPGAAELADALAGNGFELVELEPLPGADASELALRLRPDLASRARERLVVRSGGNPLLLEELAASGEATESLELALAARVRQLPPAAREALGLLALAGRPLPGDLLPGTDELARAGLVIPAVGGLAFRHPLLGEVVAGRLDAGERQR